MILSIYQERTTLRTFCPGAAYSEIRSMVDVRAEEESLVQRLKLGEGDNGEEAIQRKLGRNIRKVQILREQWWLQLGEQKFILYILYW